MFPSDSNWVLFKMDRAKEAWQHLFDNGILIRDFSASTELTDCLRATVGLPEQNDALLTALRDFVLRR